MGSRLAERVHDILGRDFDPGRFGALEHMGLLVSGNAPRSLPALHGARWFTEQFGGLSDASEAVKQGDVGVHGGILYDCFAQIATKKSHIHSHTNRRNKGMETIHARLKALRSQAQPKITVRGLAAAIGMQPSTYAAYEDPKKFKKPVLPLDLVKKLAPVFMERGIKKSDVFSLAGLTGDLETLIKSDTGDSENSDWLTVRGSVAAGVWKEQSEWPASEHYDVRFGPSPYRNLERFAVRMDGLSMNRTIQPGADLECLYVKFSPVPPRPGDLVIVERKAHDLVELTCKRLAMDGDEWVLLCESYEPEFQEPIRIGKPDDQDFTDNEVSVVGIVLSAKLDLAPRDLSERRFQNR